MKESYENMTLLLENITVTFVKVIALFLGWQLGKTKFVDFCVSEVAGTESIITSRKSGLKKNHLLQDI
jgi:hypothetical protein